MKRSGVAHILLIVIVGIVGLFAFRAISESFFKKAGSSSSNIAQISQGGKQGENCKSGEAAKFEAEFTDFDKIEAFAPLGNITAGSPGRSYIGVKKGMEAAIYAPTDLVLENIIYARRGGPGTPGEYGLYFRLGCNITILFDHLDRLSDRLASLAPKQPADSSRTENEALNLNIKKGELLAYTDGTTQAHTFDFLLIDRSKPANHINAIRWQWEQAVYSQCPYDYFVDDIKSKYYTKLGETGWQGFEKAESCGSPSHDVVGTISGGWFVGESTDTKGDYLAIARMGSRVDIAQRKDGDFADGAGQGESKLRDYSPRVYPKDVRVGQETCYFDQNQNRWAYIKLVSDNQLSFARGAGSCPASFPESKASIWGR